MRVLVTGAGGMVGRAVVEHFSGLGDEVIGAAHADLDITDRHACFDFFDKLGPDTVINCAAWTDVDGCELDPVRAFRANADGPENLASACRQLGASLITISTDYVFSGTKDGFYTQRDDTDAISIYGKSKIEGERRAISALARTTIVRSGWIFGRGGKNFLSKVIELGRQNKRLTAINDAFGTPTYAEDLAGRLRQLAELDLPGIYHVVNSGEGASFEGFVREAFGIAGFEMSGIEAVSMTTLSRPAPRPQNSRLRCLLTEAIGLTPLPPWNDALERFVAAEADVASASGH